MWEKGGRPRTKKDHMSTASIVGESPISNQQSRDEGEDNNNDKDENPHLVAARAARL